MSEPNRGLSGLMPTPEELANVAAADGLIRADADHKGRHDARYCQRERCMIERAARFVSNNSPAVSS